MTAITRTGGRPTREDDRRPTPTARHRGKRRETSRRRTPLRRSIGCFADPWGVCRASDRERPRAARWWVGGAVGGRGTGLGVGAERGCPNWAYGPVAPAGRPASRSWTIPFTATADGCVKSRPAGPPRALN